MNGWSMAVVSEIRPRVTAAISAMPDDRPSRPSMKLMLLIIPTIQTSVNPTAKGPTRMMLSEPNGLLMKVTVIPATTANAARATWPSSCQRARSWSVSSSTPMSVAMAPPSRRPTSSVGSIVRGMSTMSSWSLAMRTARATTRNAMATPMPPPRGIGRLLTRRWIGSVDVVEADREAPDERREEERDQRRRPRTPRRGAAAPRRTCDQAHRRRSGVAPRESRHREAVHQLADLAADPVVDGRVVAMADRVHDPAPDLRHLARTHAAGRRGRRPDRGSPTRRWAGSRRTGSRSC